MRKLLKLTFVLLLMAGIWLAWALCVPVQFSGQKSVLLRPGWTTHHIANELKREGVIRSADAFLLYHYFKRRHSLKAGEYLFDQPLNTIEVHDKIASGEAYTRTVVIPEGFTMFDIAAAVEVAGLSSREEFLKAARTQTTLISDLSPKAESLEGYLFPDTYQFSRIQSPGDLVSAMVRRFRQETRGLGLVAEPEPDIARIVTMASIVEKETGVPEERGEVASVYYNRLRKGMALGADPTVVYAALLAGHYRGAIYQSDLQYDSPYNTYKYPGLPPGPIANPGRASMAAAMHPADTQYLYFVSDANGHHRFARTLDEHNRNVAAYRRAVGTH